MGMQSHEYEAALIPEIAQYWNQRIHDLELAKHPVGTPGFFNDLADYRFDKLRYLQKRVDFSSYKDKKMLEIGCGAGIDAVLFAQGGAELIGIDLSETAIELAQKNFKQRGLKGNFQVMNGEELQFEDSVFDMVYAHGVVQYTASPQRMMDEVIRVLKPGGEFIGMVYNRHGWLNIMSNFFKVELEHEDAPVLEKYSIREYKNLLRGFDTVHIIPERFPVKSRLHHGLKGLLFNTVFVGSFNVIPRILVRRWGWHLMAFCYKPE